MDVRDVLDAWNRTAKPKDEFEKEAYEIIGKALQKQIPKQIEARKCDNCKKEDCAGCFDYVSRCPNCNGMLDRDNDEEFNYCPSCGQALNWEN